MTLRIALVMFPGLEHHIFGPRERERLAELGEVLTPVPIGHPGELSDDHAASVEVLLTSWGCPVLDTAAISRLPNLRLVAHAAGTVRSIVSDSLFDAGVQVTSAAPANAVPVAEFTFAAIVFCGKQVFAIRDSHRAARGQKWAAREFADLGNLGRTVGIVGASKIGRLVIERLHTLDCEILVTDPYLTWEEAAVLGVTKVELDELCHRSDVVSLHAPALPATERMIGTTELAAMRDGAWLINTARGALVDTVALTAEVVTGRLNAFIDTADPEPPPADSPLYDLPNVILTPHIAGSLGNEISRMVWLALDEITRFAAGESLLHPVLRTDLDRIA